MREFFFRNANLQKFRSEDDKIKYVDVEVNIVVEWNGLTKVSC